MDTTSKLDLPFGDAEKLSVHVGCGAATGSFADLEDDLIADRPDDAAGSLFRHVGVFPELIAAKDGLLKKEIKDGNGVLRTGLFDDPAFAKLVELLNRASLACVFAGLDGEAFEEAPASYSRTSPRVA